MRGRAEVEWWKGMMLMAVDERQAGRQPDRQQTGETRARRQPEATHPTCRGMTHGQDLNRFADLSDLPEVV